MMSQQWHDHFRHALCPGPARPWQPQVQVVATGPAAPEKYPVPTIRLLPIVKGIVSKQGMCFGWPDRKAAREAISWCRGGDFMMPFPLLQGWASLRSQCPTPRPSNVQPENITYTIGLGNNDWVNTAIYRYFRDHFYNRIGHIHCPSAFIADQLRKKTATPPICTSSPTASIRPLSTSQAPQARRLARPIRHPDGGPPVQRETGRTCVIDAVARSRHAERIQLVLAGQGPKEGTASWRLLAHPIQIGFYDKPDLMDLLAATDL